MLAGTPKKGHSHLKCVGSFVDSSMPTFSLTFAVPPFPFPVIFSLFPFPVSRFPFPVSLFLFPLRLSNHQSHCDATWHPTTQVPCFVEYFNMHCECTSPRDTEVTVDKHAASDPVHILPNTPSQAIMVQVRGSRKPTTLYKIEVLQVSEEDWANWQGGVDYPSSTAHAPTARYFPVGGAGFAPDDIDTADLHVVNTKFYATCEEEQSLEVGQTILVVAKADTGWWAGFIWSALTAPSAGWFPEGCVSPVDGPAFQRTSHYGGTPSPSPYGSPRATPMSAAMGSMGSMGGPFSRLGSEGEQQNFLLSSMRSMRSIRSGKSLHDGDNDNCGTDGGMVGEYLGALDQMSPGQLAELEDKLGDTMNYEQPPPTKLRLPRGGSSEDSYDSDEDADSENGDGDASTYGGGSSNKSIVKKKKKRRRRRKKQSGGRGNKIHPGAGPPEMPAAPARHRSPHLPLCSGLFGVVWVIMWMVQVGESESNGRARCSSLPRVCWPEDPPVPSSRCGAAACCGRLL